MNETKDVEKHEKKVREELVGFERHLTTALMVARADETIFSNFKMTEEDFLNWEEREKLQSKEELTKLIQDLLEKFNQILDYEHDSLVDYLSKSYQDSYQNYMKKVCLNRHKYAKLIDSDRNARQFSQMMHYLNRLRESTMVYYIKKAIKKQVPIIGYGYHHVKAIKLSGIFEQAIRDEKPVIYEDMTSFLKDYQQESEPEMDEV